MLTEEGLNAAEQPELSAFREGRTFKPEKRKNSPESNALSEWSGQGLRSRVFGAMEKRGILSRLEVDDCSNEEDNALEWRTIEAIKELAGDDCNDWEICLPMGTNNGKQ